MDLVQARLKAETLIQQHCPNYKFGFDRGKHRKGCCHQHQRLITLSKFFVDASSEDDVEQTILHEVAHALCPASEHHGRLWKLTAQRLGVKVLKACSGNGFAKPNYILSCSNCKRDIPAYRVPTKTHACGKCCKEFSNGKFDKRFLLTWRSNT